MSRCLPVSPPFLGTLRPHGRRFCAPAKQQTVLVETDRKHFGEKGLIESRKARSNTGKNPLVECEDRVFQGFRDDLQRDGAGPLHKTLRIPTPTA